MSDIPWWDSFDPHEGASGRHGYVVYQDPGSLGGRLSKYRSPVPVDLVVAAVPLEDLQDLDLSEHRTLSRVEHKRAAYWAGRDTAPDATVRVLACPCGGDILSIRATRHPTGTVARRVQATHAPDARELMSTILEQLANAHPPEADPRGA